MAYSLKLALSSLLFAFLAMSAFAARTLEEKKAKTKTFNPLLNKSKLYAFPDANRQEAQVSDMIMPPVALGGAIPSASPGIVVGNTWYDKQRNGSMGRMIDWGTHGFPDTMLVHFSWMYMPVPVFTARKYYYKCWNAVTDDFQCETGVQPGDEYGGYLGIDVTGDNRAIVGGHNVMDPPYGPCQSQFYWDLCPGCCAFIFGSRVPDSVSLYCQGNPGETGAIWPRFRYVEGPGPNDTVLHVIAQKSEPYAGAPQTVVYFRRVGSDQSPGAYWDYPPYCIDTIYDISHDIAARENKVALAWTANLPCPGDPCDTCSGYECWNFVQWDNDIYYQISLDYGVTWQPRVNVTKNVDGEEGYRPFTDLSALITSDGNLHIVWGARYWPADANYGGQAGLLRGRIFHWSEDWPYIRTVHNFEWDQTTCNGGSWNLNASKMTISECDNKLYVLFVQFNDPEIMMDDCAHEGNPGFPYGAANGELYLCISDDWGLNWDRGRNLTNSHTPGCDSVGGYGGPCDSDVWPSMARFGTNYVGDFSEVPIVVPEGSIDPGDWYLDIQYINDHSAGAIISDEGFWQLADVKWFRIPCVEPNGVPPPIVIPPYIDYPAWTGHGIQKDTIIIIENVGGYQIDYSVTVEEETGPSGWLDTSGFDGSVPTGLNNRDTAILILNKDGIVNDPGTIVNLVGRLIFTWNLPIPLPPDTFRINFFVVAGIPPTQWDTIATSCLALTVANNGNFGHLGAGKVNMDYVDAGDCDTLADVYLYDGSPVVGYVKDGDTIASFSIFGTSYLNQNGFVPVGEHTPVADSGAYYIFRSGTFVTHDSLIAVEKTWYAPKDNLDSCSFVIECIEVYLYDTLATPPTSVRLGEAIDWDIPSDSFADNSSGFDYKYNLIYQQGCEYDMAGCQLNDNRFGGINFLDAYKNGMPLDSLSPAGPFQAKPYGAYSHDNSTHVYPFSGFVPETLYTYMGYSGYVISDSTCSDLYSFVTFDNSLELTPADTYFFYVGIVSHRNGNINDFLQEVNASGEWYCDHIAPDACRGCCQNRGNVNRIIGPGGPIDVNDITYLVAYLFGKGSPPPCLEEGNVDNLETIPGIPIDVADLTFLVAYLFQGGAAPPPC